MEFEKNLKRLSGREGESGDGESGGGGVMKMRVT